MKSVKVSDLPPFDNPQGLDVKQVHVSPVAQTMHLNLVPGQGMKAHTSPVDILFYVLEGRGSLERDGEVTAIERDMAIESHAGALHKLQADPDSSLRVLVIKMSKPA